MQKKELNQLLNMTLGDPITFESFRSDRDYKSVAES